MGNAVKCALVTFEKDLTEQEFAIFQMVISHIKTAQVIEAIEPLYADLSIAVAEQKVRSEVAIQLEKVAYQILFNSTSQTKGNR